MPILYLSILLTLAFFTMIYIAFQESRLPIPTISRHFSLLLCVFVVCIIAFYPITPYSDKDSYLNAFNNISFEQVFVAKDVGWAFYTYLIKNIFNNANVFFALTACIYVGGYYIFSFKNFAKEYLFIFLLVSFTSFGFFAYGVNTLRAGFSLSLLLIALVYNKKNWIFITLAIFSVLCHKSMLLPLLAFVITKYYNEPKMFFKFWLFALLISFINIGFISEFIQTNLGSFDERSEGYLSNDSVSRYNSGFRVDFIIYSFIPILVGYYYLIKLKIYDEFYIRLFNTYLIANSFWLLVIRMQFTDRMAYLSWFLIPFILLYPLLKYQLNIKQRLYVGIIVFIIISFTTLMSLK